MKNFSSYEDEYEEICYKHVTLKPKYKKKTCYGFESIFINYFKIIFEKFKIFSEYKKTIENIYKNNLTNQLCKKYLNNYIKTVIEGYL